MHNEQVNMTERGCPVCNADTSSEVFTKESYRYNACDACGLVYINPIPSQDDIQSDYDELGSEYFTDARKVETDFASGRFDRELKFIKRSEASGRLLDVGCATGSFISAASGEQFVECVGIDISAPSIEFAIERGLNAIRGDFAAGFVEESSFDTVTMLATLEHLPNPKQFVLQAAKTLKPGGTLIATVPNRKSLTTSILGKRDRYFSVHHLNYFSTENLTQLMVDSGFEITQIDTRGINPFKIVEDLRGVEITVERLIEANVVATKYRAKGKKSLAMSVFSVVDAALSSVGRGDLIMIAAKLRNKPADA